MRHPRLRHLTGALTAVLALHSLPAAAQDGGLRYVFGLSQRLEARQNPSLAIPAGDDSLTAGTTLSFGLTSSTATEDLSLSLEGGLRLSQTGGEAVDSGIDGPQLAFGYDRRGANASFSASLDYSDARIETLRPLSDFLNEDGEIELPEDPDDLVGTGTRRATGADVRLDLGTAAPFGVSLEAGFDKTDYSDVTDADLVDSQSASLGATARLRFSETLSGDVSLSARIYEAEDAGTTRRETQDLDIGIAQEISPRLSVSAGAGFSVSRTEEFGLETKSDDVTARVGLDLELPNGGLAVDMSLDSAEISWQQSLPRGSIEAALSHSPDADGSGSTSVAALNYSQSLSAVSGLNLGLSYSDFSDPGENDVARTDLTASYTHSLTEDWGLSVGANLSRRDEDTIGAANSSTLFLSLSRDFEF
jgi:outer membrane usher protein FimD/PapC